MLAEFFLANVFSIGDFSGNPLPVILSHLSSADTMQKMAREFNQTESIYINEQDNKLHTRIFTVDTELPFAGHPVIGGAAVVHKKKYKNIDKTNIELILGQRKISLISQRINENLYHVSMDQGIAFLKNLDIENSNVKSILAAFSLTEKDILDNMPIALASTGLTYILIPVKRLENIKLKEDISLSLKNLGAEFSYLFTVDGDYIEGRSFDNQGMAEDPATGSAAGPLASYLVKNNFQAPGTKILIHQGQYCNRPSLIQVYVGEDSHVLVSGDVRIVGSGKYMYNE